MTHLFFRDSFMEARAKEIMQSVKDMEIQAENQKLREESVKTDIRFIQHLRSELFSKMKESTVPYSSYFLPELRSALCELYKRGNCLEQASAVFTRYVEKSLDHHFEEPVEVIAAFFSKVKGALYNDHAFVAVNKHPQADINKPDTWKKANEALLIADAWKSSSVESHQDTKKLTAQHLFFGREVIKVETLYKFKSHLTYKESEKLVACLRKAIDFLDTAIRDYPTNDFFQLRKYGKDSGDLQKLKQILLKKVMIYRFSMLDRPVLEKDFKVIDNYFSATLFKREQGGVVGNCHTHQLLGCPVSVASRPS